MEIKYLWKFLLLCGSLVQTAGKGPPRVFTGVITVPRKKIIAKVVQANLGVMYILQVKV